MFFFFNTIVQCFIVALLLLTLEIALRCASSQCRTQSIIFFFSLYFSTRGIEKGGATLFYCANVDETDETFTIKNNFKQATLFQTRTI